MCFETHVSNIISACVLQLRQLKGIRDCFSLDAAKTLVNAFVVSRFDYCNGLLVGLPDLVSLPILVGLPDKQLNRFQAVMNVAARLICRGRRYGHISPLLRDQLHWLRSRERVIFKICIMVYKALYDMAPSYIKYLCVLVTTKARRSSIRYAADGQLVVPKTSTKAGDRAFAVAKHKHGTNFQPMSSNQRHWRLLNVL